jgi:hypothetical protein
MCGSWLSCAVSGPDEFSYLIAKGNVMLYDQADEMIVVDGETFPEADDE